MSPFHFTLSQSEKEEVLTLFQELLRFDTTNPGREEAPLIRHVESILRREGIPAQILEKVPGRSNLVARLRSKGKGPSLLLTAHVDVVPAEDEGWKFPPFSATIHDGWIYGRGAVDMKHFAAMALYVFLLLHRRKVPLKGDLVLALVADEEMGCTLGMKWLCEEHYDLLRADYGLTEVGGFPVKLRNGKVVFPLQMAEKGFLWLKVRTRGEPGHGSLPHEEQAVARLAQAIVRITRSPLPFRLTPPTSLFLEALQSHMGAEGIVLKLLKNPLLYPFLIRLIPDPEQRRVFAALLHNTVSVTVLRAGGKTNVIPSEAVAELDCRYLPGVTREEMIRDLMGRLNLEVELEPICFGDPATAPYPTPFSELIAKIVGERVPGAAVVPSVTTGFTDAKWLIEKGMVVYGFTPLLLPPGVPLSRLFHATNERAPVEGFLWGVETLGEIVMRFLGEE